MGHYGFSIGHRLVLWWGDFYRSYKLVKSVADEEYTTGPPAYGAFLILDPEIGPALSLHYGRQTHSSTTDRTKHWFFPWCQWSPVKAEYLDEYRNVVHDVPAGVDEAMQLAIHEYEYEAPAYYLSVLDYDGTTAHCQLKPVRRTWHRGTGRFKWLRFFSEPKVVMRVQLEFDRGVGPKKGGMTSHGCDWAEGFSLSMAFHKYAASRNMTPLKWFGSERPIGYGPKLTQNG